MRARSRWSPTFRRLALSALIVLSLPAGATPSGTRSVGSVAPAERPWVDDRLAEEAAAYAAFVQDHPPDGFAYGTRVVQAWQAWASWTGHDHHAGYDLVMLVGWSLAQGVHGAYEAGVGRFSEALAHGRATPEDRWAGWAAQNEAAYRKTVSWYRFPVWSALHVLWVNDWPTDVSLPRQMERRYAYTSAYVLQGLAAAVTGLVMDASDG